MARKNTPKTYKSRKAEQGEHDARTESLEAVVDSLLTLMPAGKDWDDLPKQYRETLIEAHDRVVAADALADWNTSAALVKVLRTRYGIDRHMNNHGYLHSTTWYDDTDAVDEHIDWTVTELAPLWRDWQTTE